MKKIFILLSFVLIAGLSAHFYVPDRIAFPPLCEKHFSDPRRLTANTWIEPCDKENLKEVEALIKLLPKPYEAECISCSRCGGLRLNHDNELLLPLEKNKTAYKEIQKLHQQVKYGTLETCRHLGSDRC